MTQPRITPGGRADVGRFTWALAHVAGLVAGTEPPHLFLTLGRHPRLFRAWLRFAGRLMPRGRLPRRDTELVILRIAHLRACAYEWEHHVRLGRRAGIGPADLARVQAGPAADGWADRERAILTAVDELHAGRDMSDTAWAGLQPHLDARGLIELVLLAAHYEMLATAITTLRIQPDRIHQRS